MFRPEFLHDYRFTPMAYSCRIVDMDKWTEIFVTTSEIEAEIIKDILESGGIMVKIKSAKVAPYPVNIGGMGEVKILVRKINEKTARRVIEHYQKGYLRKLRSV